MLQTLFALSPLGIVALLTAVVVGRTFWRETAHVRYVLVPWWRRQRGDRRG